jgi:hypothetical protein
VKDIFYGAFEGCNLLSMRLVLSSDRERLVVDRVKPYEGLVAHLSGVSGQRFGQNDEEVDNLTKVVAKVLNVAPEAGDGTWVLTVVGQQELHGVEKNRHVLKTLGEERNRFQFLVQILVVDVFIEVVGLEDIEELLLDGFDDSLLPVIVPVLSQELVDEFGR